VGVHWSTFLFSFSSSNPDQHEARRTGIGRAYEPKPEDSSDLSPTIGVGERRSGGLWDGFFLRAIGIFFFISP